MKAVRNKAEPVTQTEMSAQTEVSNNHPPGATDNTGDTGNAAHTAATDTAPKKIFVCSPYRPTSNTEACRKDELAANINRAKTACRILTTLGFLPMAPHLYFTQFLKDGDEKERGTGMKLGMRWLEEADELWVFGDTVSEGMAAEIAKAHELGKPVRNLPEPGRVVELLLKSISEQYHVPLDGKSSDDKKATPGEKIPPDDTKADKRKTADNTSVENKGQQEAAESEEHNG